MAAFGAPKEILDQVEKENDKNLFAIWPENVESFELFTKLASQWRIGGMGGFLGLDYQSVEFLFKLYKGHLTTEKKRELFEDLQTMERAAMKVLNEVKK